jgi:hypothetical protein
MRAIEKKKKVNAGKQVLMGCSDKERADICSESEGPKNIRRLVGDLTRIIGT